MSAYLGLIQLAAFLELLHRRSVSEMLRALLGGFLLLLAHAVETRAQNARARGPAYWECLVSEADMQTP